MLLSKEGREGQQAAGPAKDPAEPTAPRDRESLTLGSREGLDGYKGRYGRVPIQKEVGPEPRVTLSAVSVGSARWEAGGGGEPRGQCLPYTGSYSGRGTQRPGRHTSLG